jgi:hypothetical protein
MTDMGYTEVTRVGVILTSAIASSAIGVPGTPVKLPFSNRMIARDRPPGRQLPCS